MILAEAILHHIRRGLMKLTAAEISRHEPLPKPDYICSMRTRRASDSASGDEAVKQRAAARARLQETTGTAPAIKWNHEWPHLLRSCKQGGDRCETSQDKHKNPNAIAEP